MSPRDKATLDRIYEKHYGNKKPRRDLKAKKVEKALKGRKAVKTSHQDAPTKEISAGVGIVDQALSAATSQCIAEGKHVNRSTLMEVAQQRGIKYFRILNATELRRVLGESTPQEEIARITDSAKQRWQAGWGSKGPQAKIHPKFA